MKHLVLALLLVAGAANAATLNVDWTNPTTNTDASTIPASGAGSLTQARIEYGTCNGTAFGTSLGNVNRVMPASTGSITVNPGTYCVRVFVANTYGNESAASNVASRVVPAPTPNPPSNLRFTDAVVFDLRKEGGRTYLSRHVATVKDGAVPVSRYTVEDHSGYCQVKRSDTLTIKSNKGVLVAKCEATA